MSRVPICEFPVKPAEVPEDSIFRMLFDIADADALNELRPLQLEVVLTMRCAASCKFCYASSTPESTEEMPLEGAKRLIKEAHELGVRTLSWIGGDPQLYPHLRELMTLTTEMGMGMQMPTSGLLSKKDIELMVEFRDNLIASIHLDTIDPATYAQVHFNPRTLQPRMNGYKRLLDSGFPPEQVVGIITMTDPVMPRIEETLDWFYDDMGAPHVCPLVFKGAGFGKNQAGFEPSLSALERAYKYRAKKRGEHWLRIGTTDGSMYYCRSVFAVDTEGHALPCQCMPDYSRTEESIFEHGFRKVFERNRDALLFNFRPKGICGDCANNDVCFGCRANAYNYAGDVRASDPKCWLNPEAKEYCTAQAASPLPRA